MKPTLEILELRRLDFFLKTQWEGECLIWQTYKDANGYGYYQFCEGGKKYSIRAHRAAFLLGGGDVDAAPLLLHSCNNPPCVRFEHLLLGTQEDNVADRVRDQRSAVGAANGRSKLTPTHVTAIRGLLSEGVSKGKIARAFNIDRKVVWLIDQGKLWRSV